MLAEEYRLFFVDTERVTVDTFDGFWKYSATAEPAPYDLVNYRLLIVDEVGYLGRARFEYAMRTWALAGRSCALIFAGDFAQQDPPDRSGAAKESAWWREVIQTILRQQHRGDSDMAALCASLRHHRPTQKTLAKLIGNRVLGQRRPLTEDIAEFFRTYPSGVLLAGRRASVGRLNEEVFHHLFKQSQRRRLLTRQGDEWETREVALAVGARVMLNMNIKKGRGEVNGAMGTIVRMCRHCIVCRLDSGVSAMVSPRRPQKRAASEGLPLELAYATTVAKIQGRTLDAVAILPDLGAPAVGYVAISRVRTLSRLFWLAAPTAAFFTPGKV